MTTAIKGALLGAVQLAMILSLGGKMLIDRSNLPRIWVKVVPFDPNLPIRGRYVSLRVTAEARGFSSGFIYGTSKLSVEDGKLVARPTEDSGGQMVNVSGDPPVATLSEPIAYFIPEHVDDPSRRPPDEELWVEVTVPPKGPPRPIQLGVKKKDGVLAPLDIH
jgi:hypothetical protein